MGEAGFSTRGHRNTSFACLSFPSACRALLKVSGSSTARLCCQSRLMRINKPHVPDGSASNRILEHVPELENPQEKTTGNRSFEVLQRRRWNHGHLRTSLLMLF